MQENGIRSKSHKKYKATTNSSHNLPVAGNILNRDFTAERPGQKMVSDITHTYQRMKAGSTLLASWISAGIR